MRVTRRLVVAAVVVVMATKMVESQLSLGSNGVSTPPINLVHLFTIAREIISHVYDNFLKVEAKDGDVLSNEFTLDEPESCVESDEKCRTLVEGFITSEENMDVDIDASRYVALKWLLAYLFVIISCIIVTLILGIPYLITGQTFRSFDAGIVPRIDQEDSLLLLAWLLGEASGDESCLERVVCLHPERSARYLAIPKVISSSLYSWMPTRYRDQLRCLDEITDNGLHENCEQYSCPLLPEL